MVSAPQSKNNPSSCSPTLISRQRNSEIGNSIRRSFSGSPFPKPSIIASQKPGFNPNTPANSPSDYQRRRNSIGSENRVVSLRDSEDKENSKDRNLKQARVQSPASSKGAKNFMSPTISASSKISASPRKKMLTERNDSIHTSISFSDGRSPSNKALDSKTENGLTHKKEVSFDPTITYLEDKEEAFKSNEDFDSVESSSTKEDWDISSEVADDCVNLDPIFRISPRTSSLPSPALAPLDADPLMPPYDPKTNFLSPRPQFLHYKPNPRIERYLNKERDGKQLEESFASESSLDAEVIEEETLSDDSQKESEDSSAGELQTEDSSPSNVREEGEEELIVSEPNPISSISEEAVIVKRVSNPHFFTRTKFTALLLALAIACLWASATNSPIMDPSVINNLSFSNPYVPPEISKFIRDNLEDLSHRFQQWVYDSFSYICNLIISFRERHKPGPLQFANLTTSLEDGLVDNYLLVNHSTFGTEVMYKRNHLVPTREEKFGIKLLEEEDQPIEADEHIEEVPEGDEIEVDHNIEEFLKEDKNEAEENIEVLKGDREFKNQESTAAYDEHIEEAPEGDEIEVDHNIEEFLKEDKNEAEENIEVLNGDREFKNQESTAAYDNIEVSVDHTVPESVKMNVTPQAEVNTYGSSATEVIQERIENADIGELESITEVMDRSVPIPQVAKVQLEEISDPRQPLVENDLSSTKIELTMAENKPENSDTNASMENPARGEPVDLTFNRIKSLLTVRTMMGISMVVASLIAAFAFICMKNRTSDTQNTALAQVPLTKKLDYSLLSVTTEHTFQERPTEVETVGESCPSEMSSFQYGSSYSKQALKGTSEAERHVKKSRKNSRRESLASSDYSTESPSFGSFTTYEKISSKHGNRDESEFTPVRRSSRIRSHVTSPWHKWTKIS